jgi:hypothetical protein
MERARTMTKLLIAARMLFSLVFVSDFKEFRNNIR